MGLEILDKTDLLENLTYRPLLVEKKNYSYNRLRQEEDLLEYLFC